MSAQPTTRDQRLGSQRQMASARLMEFADGPERGQRALYLSSGGGLDLFVMVDRSFDIGELRCSGRQIAWLGPQGLPNAGIVNRHANGGRGFNRGFGGFLVTCGLTHFGQPTQTEPLHGDFPYLPSRLLAHGECFDGLTPYVFAEGETVQAHLNGDALSLTRRIEMPIGGKTLTLRDRIRNVGTTTSALRVMYHFNLGYPLVRTGASVTLNDTTIVEPITLPSTEEKLKAQHFPCTPDTGATCQFGTDTGKIRFDWHSQQLPCLQVWRDLAPGNGVFSIEPRTALPSEPGPILEPGEVTEIALSIDFSNADLGNGPEI